MSERIYESVDDAIRSLVDEEDGEFLLVGPSADVLETLVEAANETAGGPSIRVLGESATLKDIFEDFLVASGAAELVEADAMGLRSVETPPAFDVAVAEESTAVLVESGAAVSVTETRDEGFVADALDFFGDAYEEAGGHSLRTPALSRVRETLAEEIGTAVREDFDAVLDSVESVRGELDDVTICLLVAARNGVQLYRISRWGEDVGIASQATFSRRKTELEEMGLIDTEKVPKDIGRPRLRLLLGREALREAPIEDVADVARRLIEES